MAVSPGIDRRIGHATGTGTTGIRAHAAGSRFTPALLGGLAADAEPSADLGSGVAAGPLTAPAIAVAVSSAKPTRRAKALNVAVRDATAVGEPARQ